MGFLKRIFGGNKKSSELTQSTNVKIDTEQFPEKKFQKGVESIKEDVSSVSKYCFFLNTNIQIINIPDLYSVCHDGAPVKGARCNKTNCLYHNATRMLLYSQHYPKEKMEEIPLFPLNIYDFTKGNYER